LRSSWQRLAVLAASIAVTAGCGDSWEVETDCREEPDFAAWREATQVDHLEDGDAERTRWEIAHHLARCRTLHGASKREAMAALGRAGLPDRETPRDERNSWEFYLRPDGLELDDMIMVVVFDRRGRLKYVEIGQT
jgi:hypothetical protein